MWSIAPASGWWRADFGLYDSVEAVLRDADIAMYHAKGMKRPYVFFD